MAARLNRRHQDMVREKIRASQIINRLENHALGECDMTPTQVKAAEVLLRKTLPDLSAIDANVSGEFVTRQMTDDELDRAIADAIQQAGIAIPVGGTGEASQDPEAV